MPVTTATLLPLTAVRCVMPVARIAAVRSSGVRLVSPMTSPGSRPRASAGAWSTAAEPGPQALGGGRHAPRAFQEDRRPTDREHGDAVVRRLCGSEPAVDLDGRSPRRLDEGLAAREQHRCPGAAPDPTGIDDDRRGVPQHPDLLATSGQHHRVTRHHDDGGNGGTLRGQCADTSAVPQH